MEFDAGKWLLGGAALTAVYSAWGYVRGFWGYLVSYVVVSHNIDGDVAWALAEYASKHYKRSPYGIRTYRSQKYPMRRTRQHAMLVSEMLAMGSLFWHGWRPLRVSAQGGQNNSSYMSITFLRGTFDADKLLEASAREYNRVMQGATDRERFKVQVLGGTWSLYQSQSQEHNKQRPTSGLYASSDSPRERHDLVGLRPLGWAVTDIGIDGDATARLEDLALSDDAKELLEAIDVWFRSRDWYRERRVTWKLGARLHGVPGCGKTAFVRGVAYKHDLPIYMFDLATMTNDDLRDAWKIAMANTPCVTLFEDIDAVFDLDKPKNAESPLTLDTLRQCMDGVQPHDGVLTFITTNNIDMLCPSLKREGRTDFEVEFLPPDGDGLRKIAERICADEPDLIEPLVASHEGKTGAAFQHVCTLAASKQFFARKGLRIKREEGEADVARAS